jgi:hypothetical protein
MRLNTLSRIAGGVLLGLLTACSGGPPKDLAFTPSAQDPGTMTAGVPVKVLVPPTVADGAEFPILVEFSGWSSPGGPFTLEYSDPSLLEVRPESPFATGRVTLVMAKAKSNLTGTKPLVVTARANGRSKSSNPSSVGTGAAALPGSSPSTAGTPHDIALSDALRGELAAGAVTMAGYTGPAIVRLEYLMLEPVLAHQPQRWRADSSTWTFSLRVRSNAKEDSIVAIGAYTKNDKSDIKWGYFTVR